MSSYMASASRRRRETEHAITTPLIPPFDSKNHLEQCTQRCLWFSISLIQLLIGVLRTHELIGFTGVFPLDDMIGEVVLRASGLFGISAERVAKSFAENLFPCADDEDRLLQFLDSEASCVAILETIEHDKDFPMVAGFLDERHAFGLCGSFMAVSVGVRNR